jgi:polyphosphate kinase
MIAATDSPAAPWHIVPADDKRRARLNLIRHLLDQIPYRKVEVDLPKIPKPQPQPKGVEGGLGAAHTVPDRY